MTASSQEGSCYQSLVGVWGGRWGRGGMECIGCSQDAGMLGAVLGAHDLIGELPCAAGVCDGIWEMCHIGIAASACTLEGCFWVTF